MEELIRKCDARKAVLKINPSSAYCVNNIKPVDAIEVIHAHWINKTKDINGMVDERWDCSNCWQVYWFACPDFNFCPNCGAQMDQQVTRHE